MFYLIYAPLYLISLLPFFVLYRLSDFGFFIIYHILGYRKEIVMHNLNIAFPEKTLLEKKNISRQFYKNLVDTFIETIKLLSISDKEFDKRISLDVTAVNKLAAHKNIQVHSGHQMNWEYAHLAFSKKMNVLWVGVYMQIKNKNVDSLFLKIRRKYGAMMVSTGNFSKEIRSVYDNRYGLALIADQNPGIPKNAYWLNFFNRPAPFMTGADKGAVRNKTAVVFVNFIKVKRGYYKFEPVIITENAGHFKDGELTRTYRDFLEKCIRQQPHNYLWSHRRWKWPFKNENVKRWIDDTPPPNIIN
ncbi:MAG: lysophospholipid acyltransferase family protein [Ferruginibacter sp.]